MTNGEQMTAGQDSTSERGAAMRHRRKWASSEGAR